MIDMFYSIIVRKSAFNRQDDKLGFNFKTKKDALIFIELILESSKYHFELIQDDITNMVEEDE